MVQPTAPNEAIQGEGNTRKIDFKPSKISYFAR